MTTTSPQRHPPNGVTLHGRDPSNRLNYRDFQNQTVEDGYGVKYLLSSVQEAFHEAARER